MLSKGDDLVVCFLGTKIEAITKRVETIMGPGKGTRMHLSTQALITQRGREQLSLLRNTDSYSEST